MSDMRKLINLIESVQAEQLDEGAADKLKGAIIGAAITFAAVNTDLDKVFVEPVKDAIEQFKATDKQTTDSVAVVDPDNKSILNNWVEKYQKWQEVNKQHAIVDKENKERAKQDRKNIEIKKEKRDKAIQNYEKERSNPGQVVAFKQLSWRIGNWTSDGYNQYLPTAIVDVRIYNRNNYVAIKDFVVECKWYTKEGTLIVIQDKTIYDSLNPGDKMDKTLEFNFPFNQKAKYATGARCSLKSVEYYKTVREPNRDHTGYTVY